LTFVRAASYPHAAVPRAWRRKPPPRPRPRPKRPWWNSVTGWLDRHGERGISYLGAVVLLLVGATLLFAAIWKVWIPDEKVVCDPECPPAAVAAANTTTGPPATTSPATTSSQPTTTAAPTAPASDDDGGEPGRVSRRSEPVTIAILILGALLVVLGGFFRRVQSANVTLPGGLAFGVTLTEQTKRKTRNQLVRLARERGYTAVEVAAAGVELVELLSHAAGETATAGAEGTRPFDILSVRRAGGEARFRTAGPIEVDLDDDVIADLAEIALDRVRGNPNDPTLG
jgi:hypothetical protein